MVLVSIRTLLTRKYFFIQLGLSKVPSTLKDHCLTTNLLLLFFSRKFNLKHCLVPITSFHALLCLIVGGRESNIMHNQEENYQDF